MPTRSYGRNRNMLLPAQLILGKTAAVVYVQRCGGTAPHNDNHSISRERERKIISWLQTTWTELNGCQSNEIIHVDKTYVHVHKLCNIKILAFLLVACHDVYIWMGMLVPGVTGSKPCTWQHFEQR